MATEVFKVEGMSCNHCKAAVEKAVKSLPGIEKVEVDIAAGLARVDFDVTQVGRDTIKEKIEEAGYAVV